MAADFDPTADRTLTDDDLWDVAWKESWLALAADADGGEVNDDEAFAKARELWAGWMVKRKQFEHEQDNGLPVLPVSSPAGSPGRDDSCPSSPMRANAQEFIPNTATPLMAPPGAKKDRTFFQDWLATQSPNLLEPDFMQQQTGMTPAFPGMQNLGFFGWPTSGHGQEPAGKLQTQTPPSGKPGLLGDGASYFLLDPSTSPGTDAEPKPGAGREAGAHEPDVPKPLREDGQATQGWLPSQFAWVDPFEDDSCPPPPSFAELQLPPNRSFVRSPKTSRLLRIDGFSSVISQEQLRAFLASLGGLTDLHVLGHAKKAHGMRVYAQYDSETKAANAKKVLHQKTHEYGLEPLSVTFGMLKEKKDPHERAAKAARERKSRKGRDAGRQGPNPTDSSTWKAMWGTMPGTAGVGMPAYPDFPFPNFPYPVSPVGFPESSAHATTAE